MHVKEVIDYGASGLPEAEGTGGREVAYAPLPLDFGRIEGALLLAHSDFQILCHPYGGLHVSSMW